MTKIFIAGHNGMVGSSLRRQLEKKVGTQILTANKNELDLTNQLSVNHYFKSNNIDEVYLAAAKVGGIHANNEYPAEFIYENLIIQANVIHAAHKSGVQKLLFLGSSCIYPKHAQQPMTESALLTGTLEPSNEPYAIAKIAGIKLCESYNRQYGRDYRSVMPTNLYGPGDNFHSENSHVIPALIRRFHDAKVLNEKNVLVWGSGDPRREFLFVDDMARACVFVMDTDIDIYKATETDSLSTHINIGTGLDCTIKELTELIADVVGYEGNIVWDARKPDGAPRKLLNLDKVNKLGWEPLISFRDGLNETYNWFLNNQSEYRT